MVSEGMFIPGENQTDHPTLEISVPIFLKPVLIEILSIGKSIKILRYLEIQNKLGLAEVKFRETSDFKKLYDIKKNNYKVPV